LAPGHGASLLSGSHSLPDFDWHYHHSAGRMEGKMTKTNFVFIFVVWTILMLFLGAYMQSFATGRLPIINQKFGYQITLDLPRSEYDLKKRMVINAIDRQLLEEIQKKRFFPSPEQEKE
jgi:hypothetical protein